MCNIKFIIQTYTICQIKATDFVRCFEVQSWLSFLLGHLLLLLLLRLKSIDCKPQKRKIAFNFFFCNTGLLLFFCRREYYIRTKSLGKWKLITRRKEMEKPNNSKTMICQKEYLKENFGKEIINEIEEERWK